MEACRGTGRCSRTPHRTYTGRTVVQHHAVLTLCRGFSRTDLRTSSPAMCLCSDHSRPPLPAVSTDHIPVQHGLGPNPQHPLRSIVSACGSGDPPAVTQPSAPWRVVPQPFVQPFVRQFTNGIERLSGIQHSIKCEDSGYNTKHITYNSEPRPCASAQPPDHCRRDNATSIPARTTMDHSPPWPQHLK